MAPLASSVFTKAQCHDLLVASLVGDLAKVEELLASGVSVNYTDVYHKSALHYAVARRKTAVLERLIQAGAILDVPDRLQQRTPLFGAANIWHTDAVRILLAAGASSDIPDRDGQTPLCIAILRSNRTIAGLLLERGGKCLDQPDVSGNTPLIYAIMTGHFDITQRLIEAKVNINRVGRNAQTPLHFATCKDHPETVELLLREGASVNQFDCDGRTPLWYAINFGFPENVKILLDHGAWIHARCNDEMTIWESINSPSPSLPYAQNADLRELLADAHIEQIWSPQVHSLTKKSIQKTVGMIMKIWFFGENSSLASLPRELLYVIFDFLL